MSHLLDEHQRRLRETAHQLQEHIGKDCPTSFFVELDSFIRYVLEKDDTDNAIEKINERLDRERIFMQIALVLATMITTFLTLTLL